jgi:hypothetical protein
MMRATRLLGLAGLAGLVVLAVATFQTPGFAAPQMVREVSVGSSRVHVGDLVAGLAAEAAALDLGPSPAAGGSRIVDRSEIAEALRSHEMETTTPLPLSVRVVRKVKRLEVTDIEQIVRQGLGPKLKRGVTVNAVHPAGPMIVPDGYTVVTAEIPRPPRRSGSFACDASVTFYENSQAIRMLSVPVELLLSAEAAVADVVHGARLNLVIRRGLVEITTSGTAGADADVGDPIPVVVHPSGRTIMARLEDPEHAVALDTQ